MKIVLMPVAIVKDGDQLLLRKMNPARSPYLEPWALFGGRVDGDESVQDALNRELAARWGFEVRIDEKLWWDEEIKTAHDGEEKRFVYLDVVCSIASGAPTPGDGEDLEWVAKSEVSGYELNPPTKIVLDQLLHS